MIYVSSAAIRSISLSQSVKTLAESGFTNIELTAGNTLTENWLDELLELKAKYRLNFLCHNYFPVPASPFVLNLASLNTKIQAKSIALAERALDTSRKLGGDKYAIHAGFRIDVPVAQIGKKIERIDFYDEVACWNQFIDSTNKLYSKFTDVELYIENNVFSAPNAESYDGQNPFFVTDLNSWEVLKKATPKAQLLLDVAHLKVSCQTLGLNFLDQLNALATQTDYIHLSDNNAMTDSNQIIGKNCVWLKQMQELNLPKDNTYTIEVYGDLNAIKQSYNLVEKALL